MASGTQYVDERWVVTAVACASGSAGPRYNDQDTADLLQSPHPALTTAPHVIWARYGSSACNVLVLRPPQKRVHVVDQARITGRSGTKLSRRPKSNGNARNQRRRGAPVKVWACLLARRSLGTRQVFCGLLKRLLCDRDQRHTPLHLPVSAAPSRPLLTRNWPRRRGQHGNALIARRLCASVIHDAWSGNLHSSRPAHCRKTWIKTG